MASWICSSKSTGTGSGELAAVAREDVGEAVDVAVVPALDGLG